MPPYLTVLHTIHLLGTLTVHEPPAINTSGPEYYYEDRRRPQRQLPTHWLLSMHSDRSHKHEQRHAEHGPEDHDRGRDLLFVPKVLGNDPRRNEETECEKDANGYVNADKRLIVFFCRHHLPLTPLYRQFSEFAIFSSAQLCIAFLDDE